MVRVIEVSLENMWKIFSSDNYQGLAKKSLKVHFPRTENPENHMF